jgi:hypothetical protein
MSKQHCHFYASRSLTALEQDSTIIAVIEMSQLVAGIVPGVERQPLKKLDAQEEGLLKLLHRWRNKAGQAGREIKHIVVAYEAGRDGFFPSPPHCKCLRCVLAPKVICIIVNSSQSGVTSLRHIFPRRLPR